MGDLKMTLMPYLSKH